MKLFMYKIKFISHNKRKERKGIMLSKIAMCLVIVGGINWGLVGLFNFNLVAFIFGGGSMIARAIYIIIGICSILCIPTMFMCDKDQNM